MKSFPKFTNVKAFDIAIYITIGAVAVNSFFACLVLFVHGGHDPFVVLVISLVILSNIICLAIVIFMRYTFNVRLKTRIAEPVLKVKSELDMLVNGDFVMPETIDGPVEMDGVYESLEAISKIIGEYYTAKKKNDADKLIYINGLMHDIATPITRINGYASMINDGIITDSDEIRRFTEMIVQNTEDISIMLKNLAEIEKYDDTVIRNDMLPVNVSTLLSRYIDDLKLELAQINVSISFDDYCTVPPVCMMDVKSCKRVLMNIINNSIKYRKPDTDCNIMITLDDKKKGFITLSVSDNGTGIEKESLDKIFELFYRADSTRHDVSEGNGLGLFISREIIESHSGVIYAENNPDGLTVVISLPVTDSAAVDWY